MAIVSTQLMNIGASGTSGTSCVAQQLLNSNWDGKKLVDAVKILTLAGFDKNQYCNRGCSYIERLFRSLAREVHPDKNPFPNMQDGKALAHRVYVMAQDAKDTLCKASCHDHDLYTPKASPKRTDTPPRMDEIPLDAIKTFHGQYGIDLNQEELATWCRDESEPPVRATDYFDTELLLMDFGPPIKFTYAEAFEFVIRQINQARAKGEPCKLGIRSPSNVRQLYWALTNIEVANPPHYIPSVVTYSGSSYISWMDVICFALQQNGLINECRYSPHASALFIT
jgi:hypothetical protein